MNIRYVTWYATMLVGTVDICERHLRARRAMEERKDGGAGMKEAETKNTMKVMLDDGGNCGDQGGAGV